MRKKVWLVAILIAALIAVIAGVGLFEEHKMEFADGEVYPEIEIIEHEIKTTVKPWEDSETGLVHFFLPGGIDSTTVYLGSVSSDNLRIGEDFKGKFTFTEEKEYSISYKGRAFKAVFHTIPNMSSVFIDTKSKSSKTINSDKEKTETGKILSISKEGTVEYYGKVKEIKGHGNLTWTSSEEKKPYSVKLEDAANIGELSSVNEFILLGMYHDGDKIHTKLALDLAQIFDPEVSVRSTYINLYLNGNYLGLYLATDPPKKIEKLNSDECEFLVEKDLYERAMEEDHFSIDSGDYFSVGRPKNPTKEFLNSINAYIQKVDDNIREGNTDYIDVESFAKQSTIQFLSHNVDAMRTSSFFYKMKDDNLLYAGPAWDFDSGFGEAYPLGERYVSPQGSNYLEDFFQLQWFCILEKNDYFRGEVQRVLLEHLDEIDNLFTEKIDNYEKMIEKACHAENIRWKWTDIKEYYRGGHYQEWKNNVKFLKYFCQSRLEYICSLYDIDTSTAHFEGNGEIHKLSFVDNGRVILELEVKDGEMVNTDDYPELSDKKWMFPYFEEVLYKNVPIFEDCELVPYIY